MGVIPFKHTKTYCAGSTCSALGVLAALAASLSALYVPSPPENIEMLISSTSAPSARMIIRVELSLNGLSGLSVMILAFRSVDVSLL